ncbi:MAG: hypothetical protein MUO62_12220, partial [Anaerolineales bacterium]|nr:hypothetical protein [Anaerolineales bacterium]
MKKTTAVIKSVFKFSYFYPLLFSLFPIIALYNFNIEYVHYTAILRSMTINIVAVLFILVAANLTIRNQAKAAVVTTYLVFLFYLYGHLFTWIDTRWPGLVQNRYLTAMWAGLLLVGIWFILKKSAKIEDAKKFLSVVSLTLMVVALYNSISFEVQKLRSNRDNLNNAMAQVGEQFSISLEALPDIYYIILDAHTRSD